MKSLVQKTTVLSINIKY